MPTSAQRKNRSGCPIATTMEIIGDRWTLVLIRDFVNGKRRFSEFLASPEGITPSVLTARLAAMHKAGLVSRHAYQARPVRFEHQLTAKGRTLLPVLQDICRWGNRHYPDTWEPPTSFMELATRELR